MTEVVNVIGVRTQQSASLFFSNVRLNSRVLFLRTLIPFLAVPGNI
jgi:hypothetical protein